MTRFKDKTILITGGTSGIGLATAERILSEGGRVIVTGSRDASLEKARATLPGAVLIKNDSGAADTGTQLVGSIKSTADRLDGVFLNAGHGRFQPLESISAKDFEDHYHVLVRGPLLQAQALAPLMHKGASILFTGSIAASIGVASGAIYSSTKGAVRTLVRSLAAELAPKGIRVNSVAPGPIGTGFFERTGMSEAEINSFSESILRLVPLGRFGEAKEVAAVAAFLLSDDASYVTGSEYVVDGGTSEI
jgi:NAD(P)-dependent dehydrogenase (short-subunit alcohol dehydrogenase family)